ncbi:MAG: T9SS type A sorting domain-containing protein [Bacteroidetes bacterium]|nr:T9SS type A sorting domain-containing protein [Bacteroidota bacterium]
MKKIYKPHFIKLNLVLIILLSCNLHLMAQWLQTKGPAAGISKKVMVDNSGMFISGTIGGGIFVSTDDGQTWEQRINGINQHSLTVDDIDTVGQSIFMMGTSSFMKRLYQSTDHAQTWTENALSFTNGTGLEHIGNRIFVATNSDGLLYSDDLGINWDTLPTASVLGTIYPAIYDIHVIGNDLFVNFQDSGLYKTSAAATTWTKASIGISQQDIIVNMVSTGSTLWLVHQYSNELYKSVDGGIHWSLMPAIGNNNSIEDLYALNGNLYVITEPHIYLTIDNGLNFTNFSGSVNTKYQRLCYNGTAFISISSFFGIGVQRSITNGATWNESNYGYANSRTVSLFPDGNNLFASTYDRDMFITSDAGLTYTRIPSPIVNDLFFANDIIKVGADIVEGGYSKMYRSSNNGNTWVNCSPGIPIGCDVQQFLLDGTDLFAATTMGVYKSTTSFGNWLPSNTGIPAGTELNSIVKSGTRIIVCGKTASYDARLYYSDNGGTSWTDNSAALNLGAFSSADKLIVSGTNILLSAGFQLYASTDNGVTWNISGVGMPFGRVNKFYQYGTDLFAGMGQGEDPYGEILISRDYGANWTSIRDNLFNSNVSSMAIMNGDLFVGTAWGGVWKRPVATITVDVPKINSSNTLFAIYPNPAKEKVKLNLNNNGKFKAIEIRNNEGELIYSIATSLAQLEIDTKQFANGFYVVKCLEDNYLLCQKLVICH